jgi:phosphatidylserine/phosphatidylglycerophosphate/cardiolipin synthase-like enzyme
MKCRLAVRPLFFSAVALPIALLFLVSHGCNGTDAPTGPEDFAGVDFTGLDLTGVDLAGGPATLETTSDVQVIVEPGDNGSALLSAINGATTSVHMVMYQLTAQNVVDALIARKKAGKDVKVLLNKTFPAGMGSNDSVYASLQSAGVSVKWAPSSYQYTHEKSVMVDGTAAVITTMNASQSAFNGNREYVAIDHDVADVTEAEALFQADWSGQSMTMSTGKLLTAPDNGEGRLVALIDQATSTVDLEGETFSASSLLEALGRADKRGVTVRVVLSDETPTNAQALAVMSLKQVNIPVHVLSNPFVHAKAIVADGKIAYVGSMNFTANSLENNRELGLLVSKASEVKKVADTIATDFANGVAQ